MIPMELPVVGSINADITAFTHRLPTAGETVDQGSLTRTAGGKGANQAAAASRLGARTTMVGAVGDDHDGVDMVRSLEDAGVRTSLVRTVDEPTGTALIVVDASGENQITVCNSANMHVNLDDAADALTAADVLLAQLEIPVDVVCEAAERSRGFFALNASPAVDLPPALQDRADLIIVNETEFSLIPSLASARRVVVTYGARGAVLLECGRLVAECDGFTTGVVNTVGAGDAFTAAVTLALSDGLSGEDALTAACAVGAAAVEDPSSRPPFRTLDHYIPYTRN